MNARKLIIGIDAGGTKIRGVLMSADKIIKRAEMFHGVSRVTKVIFLRTLYAVLDALYVRPRTVQLSGAGARVEKVAAIGIGLPGIIAHNRVVGAGNVKVLTTLNIQKLARDKYHTNVVLDNDVKVALRAEAEAFNVKPKSRGIKQRGTKQFSKYKSIFMLTLGTGIGAAWWRNGEVMRGSFGTAYEFGQMVLDKKKNHFLKLEDFCARKFFKTKGITPLVSEQKARAGSTYHKKLWREFGNNLGIALANVINLIEPECIIIGGGIAHAWPLFAPAMKRTAKKFTLSKPARKKTKFTQAKLGKWSGAIGAALLAVMICRHRKTP